MASKKQWEKRIREQCKEAGTYQPFFEDIILTLSEILEKRDITSKQFKQTGSMPVVKYTNKSGNTNPSKNPILVLWDDLNKTALTYWRELGLTPAGYKKITGDKPREEQGLSGLAAALASIEG